MNYKFTFSDFWLRLCIKFLWGPKMWWHLNNLCISALIIINFISTSFCCQVVPYSLHLIHKLCSLFLVNLPMFTVRILLWHLYTRDVSIFIIKNLLGIFYASLTLFGKYQTKPFLRSLLEILKGFRIKYNSFHTADGYDNSVICSRLTKCYQYTGNISQHFLEVLKFIKPWENVFSMPQT